MKFFIGIEPNITDRKELDKFKEAFISAVGHQLRDPLTIIKWILEGLLAGDVLGKSERQELEKIYAENKTLADLVEDLLILARVEKGSLYFAEIKLDQEAEESIAEVKKKYPSVTFSFNNTSDMCI